MDCKRLEAHLVEKKYDVKCEEKPVYSVELNQEKYGVCYCVRYRPVWLLEWILARWRWNDKGIWTADWTFNDWNI